MKDMFEYLFYKIYRWNTTIVKEKDFPLLSTVLELSAFHILNFTTFVLLGLNFIVKDVMIYPKWAHVLSAFIILYIDYLVFGKKEKRLLIIKKFGALNNIQRRKKDIFIIFYVVITLVVFAWAVYRARKSL